jgi:hypothetical protein
MEMHFHFNCHFFFRYIKFALELDSNFKSKPKFLMVWKFSAPLTTMYTPKTKVDEGLKHRGHVGWYLDMPKGIIPYDEASFHNGYVVKQAINNFGGASIEVPPHDDLEQINYITSQVAFIMAQAILASMVGPKGCKSKI